MHNAWMRAVCGRLKSDYRYSKNIVYNNFIWPQTARTGSAPYLEAGRACRPATAAIVDSISAAAQTILDARKRYLDADPACTLAILYNPETMPPDLVKAHQRLDALVDRAYGRSFASDADRVAHLFRLYGERTGSGGEIK